MNADQEKERKEIMRGLAEAVEQLHAADPQDQAAIVRMGQSLEQSAECIGGLGESAAALLEALLQGLQGLYMAQSPNPEAVRNAVVEGIVRIGCLLESGEMADDTLCAAAEKIKAAATEPPAEALAEEEPPAEAPEPKPADGAMDLDDIAAALVTASAENCDLFARIRDALAELLEQDELPAPMAKALKSARALGTLLASGNAADPDDALGHMVSAIELATVEQMRIGLNDGAAKPVGEAEEPAAADEVDGDAAESDEPEGEADSPAVEGSQETSDAPETGRPVLPADTDVELLGEFIAEALDHINASEAALLEIEANPDDKEAIHTVFRAFHTIKGTSGFLGLDYVQKLAHLAENLLDRARDGEIRIAGGYADVTLQSCDVLKAMIGGLAGVQPGDPTPLPGQYEELAETLANPEAAGLSDDETATPSVPRLGELLVAQGVASRESVEAIVREQGGKKIGEKLIESGQVSAKDVAKALRTQRQLRGGGGPAKTVAVETSIRVNTGRLDNLVNMVGELVIAQSMVAGDPRMSDGTMPRLSRNVAHTGKIIRELQEVSMSLRMVPLRDTFRKMARLVRDLAKKSGKRVQLITEGEDTEIDRNMVEALNDPLVHMVRNAVDHGCETVEARASAGKSGAGVVCLRAYHAAGSVVIELQDDGKGLDREKLLQKGVSRGLVEPGREMSDAEVYSLIFRPGFSTAEKITDISGRGVGMDVVKKGIDALRGRVDVASVLGSGTTFTIRLPLTMAIIDAMLLRVGEERYLLPTVSIEQSFRPTPGSVSTVTGKGEVAMLRGNLIRILRLHELFGVDGALTDPRDGLLISVEVDNERYALMVDELLGQQQVVIKPLGAALANLQGVSGGAILGDGHVGLILDPANLLAMSMGSGGKPGPAGGDDALGEPMEEESLAVAS